MAFGTDQAWGVILPVQKEQLLRNPSVEHTTTDWNNPVGFIAGRISDAQAFGAVSLATPGISVGPILGCTAGPWTASAGSAYTASIYLKASGESMKIGVGDNADVSAPPTYQGTSAAFTVGGGTWQRYSFSYTEGAGGARYLTILAAAGAINNGTIYMDGAMVEAGSLTTYIDGNQPGCYWTGAPHLSTSVRSGTSRAGGTVVALADLGFRVETSPGIGMPPLETTGQSFALTDGAQFQRQRAGQRSFTLAGYVQGTATQTRVSLHAQRQALIDALKIDLVSPQQPTTFWYVGGPGTLQISAVMDAGLGFDLPPGQFTENPGIRFIAFDPFSYATTDQGTALLSRQALGSVNHIAWRDPLGRWGTMGVNGTTVQANFAGAAIYTVLPLTGGTVLVGGLWGTIGGTVYPAVGQWLQATNRFGTLAGGSVLRTNPQTTTVNALVSVPSGSVFLGGNFGTAGGTQGAWYVARWNGVNFGTLIGGTLDGQVSSLLFTGTLFVSGGFGVVGGTATQFLAQHVNNAWGTLTGGTITQPANALAQGLDGRIFAAGNFETAGGTVSRGVAYWNGAWGSMGTLGGAAGDGLALTIAPSGIAYIGGAFTDVNGGSASNLASYNGMQLFAAGSGVRASGIVASLVDALLVDRTTGDIYVGGQFSNAGGIPIADGLAVYNGYSYRGPDISISPSGTFFDVAQSADGTIYAAGTFRGTAQCASVATVINAGRRETYPIWEAQNQTSSVVRIYQLVNTLTGNGVYFNYSMQPGETVTFDFAPGAQSFTSNFAGNIYGKIIPGSDPSTFRLMPGTNYISFFSESNGLNSLLYWRPRGWSMDAGTNL
jgi:hypothetical protein